MKQRLNFRYVNTRQVRRLMASAHDCTYTRSYRSDRNLAWTAAAGFAVLAVSNGWLARIHAAAELQFNMLALTLGAAIVLALYGIKRAAWAWWTRP